MQTINQSMKHYRFHLLYTFSLCFLSSTAIYLSNLISEQSDTAMASSMAITSKANPKTFKHALCIKLNNENYLLCKQQVLAAIRGHNLLHFLDSSDKPARFLTEQDEIGGNTSTDYLELEQQDQLLVSWLLSSMTEGVLTRMEGCDTAFQIWTKLHIYFAAQTRAKVSQLKLMLQNVKKSNLNLIEYLSKVKNIVDRVASVGLNVSVEDHIEAIFGGLPQ